MDMHDLSFVHGLCADTKTALAMVQFSPQGRSRLACPAGCLLEASLLAIFTVLPLHKQFHQVQVEPSKIVTKTMLLCHLYA
jgi:hypothetical protein